VWFQPKEVDIGQDRFGNGFKSAVVVPAEARSAKAADRAARDAAVVDYLTAHGATPEAKLQDEFGRISTRKPDAERKAWEALLKRIGAQVDQYGLVTLPEGTGAESTL
jgi:hypothetical protein